MTLKTEIYEYKYEFVGVTQDTCEPILTKMPTLIYSSNRFVSDDDILTAFKAWKDTYVVSNVYNEHVNFREIKELEDGLTVISYTDSYKHVTSIFGWKTFKSDTKKTFHIIKTSFDSKSTINDCVVTKKTITEYNLEDEKAFVEKLGELVTDYQYEIDCSVSAFPVTYCSQGGVYGYYDYENK